MSTRCNARNKIAFYLYRKKGIVYQFFLKVGFDTIDFGSFVSPKAIPQMRDTAAVLSKLDCPKLQVNYWQLLPM